MPIKMVPDGLNTQRLPQAVLTLMGFNQLFNLHGQASSKH